MDQTESKPSWEADKREKQIKSIDISMTKDIYQ